MTGIASPEFNLWTVNFAKILKSFNEEEPKKNTMKMGKQMVYFLEKQSFWNNC